MKILEAQGREDCLSVRITLLWNPTARQRRSAARNAQNLDSNLLTASRKLPKGPRDDGLLHTDKTKDSWLTCICKAACGQSTQMPLPNPSLPSMSLCRVKVSPHCAFHVNSLGR